MNQPPACITAHLLALLSARQKAGSPCHWRATHGRVWISAGDPTPALVEAGLRFPGATGKGMNDERLLDSQSAYR